MSAPKLHNLLLLARLRNCCAGSPLARSSFARCSRAVDAVRRAWRGWTPPGTPGIDVTPSWGLSHVAFPPSHLPTALTPALLLILTSREEGTANPRARAAKGGWQNGAKMGILGGFPEFPHSTLEEIWICLAVLQLFPLWMQTHPREGEEQLTAHLSARVKGRAKILWPSHGKQLCLWIQSSMEASG